MTIIVHTKSFSSKKNTISNKKVNNKENYNTLNNYYKIPKTKHIKPKEKNNKNINSIKTKEFNQKNNRIYNTHTNTNNRKEINFIHKKHNSNSNLSVRIHDNLNIKNYDIIEGEEPYQISISKYSESNFDNHSIFNNSKMNNNFPNNKIQIPTKKENVDNAILKNQKFNKKIPIKKMSQNDNQKPHPNFIKHNLIINNNYYIKNN